MGSAPAPSAARAVGHFQLVQLGMLPKAVLHWVDMGKESIRGSRESCLEEGGSSAESQHSERLRQKILFFVSMTGTGRTRSAQMSSLMCHIPISIACISQEAPVPQAAPCSTFRAHAALVPPSLSQPSFLLWLISN